MTGTVRRTVGAERGMLAALGLLVLVTVLLATGAPRLLVERYDVAARSAASGAELVVSGASASEGPEGLTGPQNPEELDQTATLFKGLAGPALRALLSEPERRARTDRLPMAEARTHSAMSLSWDPQAQVRYVSGQAPRSSGELTGLQAGLAVQAAERLGVKAGDHVRLEAAGIEKIVVSGLYEAVPGPYWERHPELLTAPDEPVGDDLTIRVGTALLDAQGFTTLRQGKVGLTYTWRFGVDADRVTAADVPDVIADVDAYQGQMQQYLPGRMSLTLATDLDQRLDTFHGQLRVTQTILLLSLSGLAAVAAGVLLLACRLLHDRLRSPLSTMRARGASTFQLAALAALVAGVAVLPAGLLGFGLGLLAPGPFSALSVQGAATIVILGICVPAVLAAVAHRGTGANLDREDLVTTGLAPRRLVLEALAVTLAVAGVAALRGRGLTTESAEQGADPFLAAVPVLLVLAVGLLVLRLYPYPLRAVGVLVRRSRAAVPFLGVAAASRQRLASALPLIVLLMATSVAGFAATVDAGLRRAQTDAAWHTVGADGRVTGTGLNLGMVDKIKELEGVSGATPLRTFPGRLTAPGTPGDEVTIIAVDLDDYRKTVEGRPVEVPPAPPAGGALLTSGLRAGALSWPGGGSSIDVKDTGRIESFPGFGTSEHIVLVPYMALGGEGNAAKPSSIYVRGGITADTLRRAGGTGTGDTVDALTVSELHADLTEAPLVTLVHRGFAAGALLVGGYGMLAVLLTMVISAAARGRTVAYLRTLGLSTRQVRGLALIELGPVIAAATLAGWAVGLALPRVIGPAVDLRPYTGGVTVADFGLDAGPAALLIGGVLLFASIAVAADSAVTARRRLDDVLRVGER